jgi:negative regulator of replication initiation
MIPERQGLALSRALQERPDFAESVTHMLNSAEIGTADQEQAVLTAALEGRPRTYRASQLTDFGQSGVTVKKRKINGRPGLVLTGDGVTDALAKALSEWLAQR